MWSLATSTDGQKLGGYNSKGWVGLGENRAGLSNFLFAWRRDGGFDKLPKVGGAGMGVVDKPETGPYFGPEGLTIPLFSKSPRRARCKLGPYYQRMPSGGNSMFEGGAGRSGLGPAPGVCGGLGRRADSLSTTRSLFSRDVRSVLKFSFDRVDGVVGRGLSLRVTVTRAAAEPRRGGTSYRVYMS